MAAAATSSVHKQIFRPEYVRFLLDPSTPINFRVNVKDPASDEMESIKAIRWMLIARSKVLRVMLLESQLKTGKEFDITDLDPETFKHFLTYIYGHDNTSSLPFEDAVKLLGAAEKYDVQDLKSKLATEITQQVMSDNVCTVIEHGPICETVPALWQKTTEIVQNNTQGVFDQKKFLDFSPEAVVFILQQEALSVPEVNIWQAALKWARHQLYMTNGVPTPASLRTTMVPLLQHTRLCTLTPAEMCKAVVPTRILTPDEIYSIFLSKTEPKIASELDQVCCRTDQRKIRGKKVAPIVCSETDRIVKTIRMDGDFTSPSMCSKYKISTKRSKIVLTSVEFMARPNSGENMTYNLRATVDVKKVKVEKSMKKVTFEEQILYDELAAIPVNVHLEANTEYTAEVRFASNHPVIYYRSANEMKTTSIDVEINVAGFDDDNTLCEWSHIRNWYYKVEGNC